MDLPSIDTTVGVLTFIIDNFPKIVDKVRPAAKVENQGFFAL